MYPKIVIDCQIEKTDETLSEKADGWFGSPVT
jgi:hypothetical protein